ncbi:MAG: energy transducer TonB [Bacteroidales bacterium]|nr:energy transducer TonB [Bacteroidales bacterium]
MSFIGRFGLGVEHFVLSMWNSWLTHRVGVLTTLIFHLLVAILFMFSKIETRKEFYGTTIEMEFEQPEELKEEVIQKSEILPLDAVNPDFESEAIKNFAVDASDKDLNPGLSDEKNIDADELYSEANRLKEQMDNNKQLYEEAQKDPEGIIPNTPEKNIPEQKKSQYKGPTVASYFLEGRKAIKLPIPSYKCQLGGQVVVNIVVAPDGRVVDADIDRANSVTDECINDAAVNAALRSLFTKASGGAKQKGSITYLFVRQ